MEQFGIVRRRYGFWISSSATKGYHSNNVCVVGANCFPSKFAPMFSGVVTSFGQWIFSGRVTSFGEWIFSGVVFF